MQWPPKTGRVSAWDFALLSGRMCMIGMKYTHCRTNEDEHRNRR